MTAEAERLVGHRPGAFLSGMRRGEEFHPLQYCRAFGRAGIRINECVEVLQRRRKGTYDAELVARETLHGPQRCSGRRDCNNEPRLLFECPPLEQLLIGRDPRAQLRPSGTWE